CDMDECIPRSDLCRAPLSGGGDQPCIVAVFPVSAEPSDGGGDAGGMGHHGEPRDGAAMGLQVRPRIRQPAPASRAAAGRQWHLDEVALTIAGKRYWLWRAVDQDGFVLDVLVRSRRDRKAARRPMRKLMR